MKYLKFMFLFVMVSSVVLFSSCGDDNEEEEVSTFVGNFVISKATVSAPTNLSTVQGIPVPIIVGMDITTTIQQALLSSVQCASADKSWVELRKDKSIYMSCEGKNAFNAGTWDEISVTEIKLNMNSAAIPSSPTGTSLTVTKIIKTSSGWKGTTSVPMPKEMFAEALAASGLTIAPTPPVYTVTFDLEFSKK
jgi:hypothetical protein